MCNEHIMVKYKMLDNVMHHLAHNTHQDHVQSTHTLIWIPFPSELLPWMWKQAKASERKSEWETPREEKTEVRTTIIFAFSCDKEKNVNKLCTIILVKTSFYSST